MFSTTHFPHDGESFFEKYKKTQKLCNESNFGIIFTINDIIKYLKLRKSTYDILDESTVSQMIFAYQFPQFEMIQSVLTELGMNEMKFIPCISYNQKAKKLYIQVSKESKTGISLKYNQEEIDKEYYEGLVNCLTIPQKQCLIFLACSVLMKRTCLIQGDTASGKSHLIRLLAHLLGKELFVYQVNSDTGMQLFAGQSILDEKLSEKDITDIRNALDDLRMNKSLNDYINETFDNVQSTKWTQAMFQKLISQVDDVIRANGISSFVLNRLTEAKDLIQQIILPVNRFHHVESSFIKAMNEGHWVLIDGIESAPPEIAEKLSSLCGDDPEFDLFECGQGYYFSRKDVPGSRPIHQDFHLFVTFNPISTNESKTLDHSFINKCLSITLPPIDSIPEYSAQILLGSLVNMRYPPDISIEIGARMALMHQYARNESLNDQESFAGDMKFTGRTLKFITKAFNYHSIKTNESIQHLHEPIIMSMKSFYFNSYVNNLKALNFQSAMIDKMKENPSNEMLYILNSNQESAKNRNRPVLEELRLIQKYILGDISDCNVNLMSFVEKCKLIIISDLAFVHKYIDETIKMLKMNCNINNVVERNREDNIKKLTNYSWLVILEKIFKDIVNNSVSLTNEQASLPISDNDLLANKDACKSLSRFQLLCELLKDNSIYITNELPISVIDENLFKLMEISL